MNIFSVCVCVCVCVYIYEFVSRYIWREERG